MDLSGKNYSYWQKIYDLRNFWIEDKMNRFFRRTLVPSVVRARSRGYMDVPLSAADLRKRFDALDTNNDGSIDLKEFLDALAKDPAVDIQWQGEQIVKFAQKFRENQNYRISFEEFKQFYNSD